MEQDLCPIRETCPFYDGKYKNIDNMNILREIYCKAGADGRNRCKRYRVFMINNSCPEDIQPNSVTSIEEIVNDMKKQILH